MRKVNYFFSISFLMALTLALVDPALAQTQKLALYQNELGEKKEEPYITNDEFLEATVTGDKHGKSTQRSVPFGKILTLPSLDSLTQYLGRPEEMSEDSPFGKSVLAYVNYKGLELEYVKAQGSDFKLRELKLLTPEWKIMVNGTRLQPGVEMSTLDESVRQAGHILIAAPGAAQKAKSHGKLQVMGEGSSIQIDFDEAHQQIKEVRFHRLL
jgi:hypothetical protein